MAAVAIIIPAYDPGPLLKRALASVTAQSFTDWECVVIDDGGSERLEWLEGFHPQITYYRQDNAGVSIARNNGVARTTAPLVAFLDQDDEWLPGKLDLQVPRLANSDFCYTSFLWVGPDGDEVLGLARPIDYPFFLDDGHLCLSSLIVRRELLDSVGGFDPMLRIQQDYELVLRLLVIGARPAPVDTVLTRYYLHQSNVSDDYLTGFRERMNILALHAISAHHRDDTAILAAIAAGRARMRRLYGAKAFDAFRDTHAPVHIARAAAWHPGYALPRVVGALYRRATGR